MLDIWVSQILKGGAALKNESHVHTYVYFCTPILDIWVSRIQICNFYVHIYVYFCTAISNIWVSRIFNASAAMGWLLLVDSLKL